MNDAVNTLQENLQQIKKGLFLMGKERARALSTHETEDLIAQLQVTTEQALQQLDSLTD